MEGAPNQQFVFAAVLMLIALASDGVIQFSNAQSICSVSVSDLMASKPTATPPRPSAPTSGCCSALSKADIPCLCYYRNSVFPAYGIDPNLALQLLAKCKIPYPPNC